ncbi:MAG: T9SS type A sorting domain-containing protein [Bacteroidota bacterium]
MIYHIKHIPGLPFKKLLRCSQVFLFFLATLNLSAQTYTFTPSGATGSVGPTQGQVTSAYALTSLSNAVVATAGIQTFTIPVSGLYNIEAVAGSGGNRSASTQVGGFGVSMIGNFNLVQGDVLKILVGQKGVDGTNTASGGGGTFVERNGILLIAAGAGGGATGDNSAANGTTLTAGTVDFPGGSIPGGSGGSGGQVCNASGTNHGGGGGGYLGNGATSSLGNAGGGGLSFVNGGIGGACPVPGAFGGGGGATAAGAALYGGGGGGGGYSGGAGGQQVNHCTPGINRSGGGGGGSYNSGTNQVNTVLNVQGDGRVVLTSLCNISINTPANPICFGTSIILTTDAASGITWSSGSTANTIAVTPTATTVYSVTGTSTANCVANSVVTITVNPLPVISTVISPSVLCVGNAATITANGANTYTWSINTTGASATVSPLSNTTYSVVGKDLNGCMKVTTAAVVVNTNSLTVTPASNLCKGSAMNLTASGAVTYTWSTGHLYASAPVSPTATTVYTVTAIDVYNCKLMNTVQVTVINLPPVVASANNTIICKGESVTLTAGGASTYTWNTGFVGAVVSYTLPVDIDYQYSVAGADAFGCVKTATLTVSVAKCTGIHEDIVAGHNIAVMPNPGTGLFNIYVEKTTERLSMSVYNELGQLVKTQEILSSANKLDLTEAKPGIYFVKIIEKDQVLKVVKLIKE